MAEDTASNHEGNSEELPTPTDAASTQPEPDSPAEEPDSAEESPTPADAASAQPEPDSPGWKLALVKGRRLVREVMGKRLFILASTLVVVVMVVSVFWIFSRREHKSSPEATVVSTAPTHADDRGSEDSLLSHPVLLQETAGVSWKTARAAFAKKDYAGALKQYSALWKILHGRPKHDFMSGFFQLRIGQCHQRLHQDAQANKSLIQAADDLSPAVRAAANYELASLAEAKGRYLQARMRAYLASANSASLPDAEILTRECDFLIARVLTKKVLSFYQKNDPTSWDVRLQPDLFIKQDMETLAKTLEFGARNAAAVSITPKVTLLLRGEASRRFSVSCWRTSLEDLLGCIATKTDIELRWAEVPRAVRQRQVSMHSPGTTAIRLCEMAAGSAGLVARFTGEEVIVFDPVDYESMSHRRKTLRDEAISVWRRLFLRAPQDERIAEGHFAVAMMDECSGETVDAINGYRLTAQRFPRSKAAPLALLRNARLLMQLRDYKGAKAELGSLLNRYPDCDESAQVYAALGEAAMKIGSFAEASRIFNKLYFMNLSVSSRLTACFNAAESFLREGDYKNAITWIDRYIAMPSSPDQKDLAEAYLLRSRVCTAAGMSPQAVETLRLAIAAGLSPDRKIDALLALARAYQKVGNSAKAIAALELASTEAKKPQQKQKYRILHLTAEVYRSIGLPSKAAILLSTSLDSISDPKMNAELRVELARCLRQAGQMSAAYEAFSEALPGLPAGESAYEAACDLAEVSLATGRAKQANIIAAEVLRSSADAALRQRARNVLVGAYLARGQYDTAVMALVNTKVPGVGGKEQ